MLPTQITKKGLASVSWTVDWRLITNLTICFIALFLCDRFGQAKDMVLKTSEYYIQLTSTISPAAQKKWEQEIKSAESRRLDHLHAMDIISAHRGFDRVKDHLIPFLSNGNVTVVVMKMLLHCLHSSSYFSWCVMGMLVSSYFFKLLTRGGKCCADRCELPKGEVPFLSASSWHIVVVVGVEDHILQAVGCHFEQKSKCLYLLLYLSVCVIGWSGNAHTAVCLSMGAGSSVT